MDNIAENVNDEWKTPLDFGSLVPLIGMLRGMISHTTVSPFIEDEFYYLGFNYFLDFSLQTKP
jgi:hypothetical protein